MCNTSNALQASKQRTAEGGQGESLDAYLQRMGVTSDVRDRLMEQAKYGPEQDDEAPEGGSYGEWMLSL